MHAAAQQSPELNAAVQHFARMLGKAVAKFGVLFGIPINTMFQVIREAYVEAATEALADQQQEPIDSKIALLTGLSRKAIPTVRIRSDKWQLVPFTNVLGFWKRQPKYHDSNGAPSELPIQSADEPSFSDLVREFCGKETSVKLVADYLDKSGNIELTDYGTVRLLTTRAAHEDLDLATTYGANSISWHADTVINNLKILLTGGNKTDRLLEHKRYSWSIPITKTPQLNKEIRTIFGKAEQQVIKLLDTHELPDEALNTRLYGAGWFVFYNPVSKQY